MCTKGIVVRGGEPGQFAAAPLPSVPPPRRPSRPASSRWLFAAAPRPATSQPRRPCQQHLPDSSLPRCRHPLRHSTPGQQLCHGAPVSNKPHMAEKSTPVWLAIWRTWAGFANSQLRRAAFATPDNICAHLLCCNIELLLRQTQISRPICTDCLRHLRISAR